MKKKKNKTKKKTTTTTTQKKSVEIEEQKWFKGLKKKKKNLMVKDWDGWEEKKDNMKEGKAGEEWESIYINSMRIER